MKSPVLFIGHGSPMHAISRNAFTEGLEKLGHELPQPRAIVCISAHWLTEGTWVTHMTHPKTIHDFGGFPQELFEVQYPAPGSPEVAELVAHTFNEAQLDNHAWGLDHGTWSVLKHMYPEANVPVVQLSIDYAKPGRYHFEVGQKIKALRDENILILGSGNIVHNLRAANFRDPTVAYDWAIEFDQIAKEKLLNRDFDYLTDNFGSTESGRKSVPTPDHYYPLLYILGASEPSDTMAFDYEGMEYGSLSMRSVRFGSLLR